MGRKNDSMVLNAAVSGNFSFVWFAVCFLQVEWVPDFKVEHVYVQKVQSTIRLWKN